MTAFELQIIALILVAFVLGVAIGYILRARVFPPVSAPNETGGITLESRQERPAHSLLRGGASSKSGSAARAAPKPKTKSPAQSAPAKKETKNEPVNAAASSAKPDNLQDIKGIGAVLEKKLNAMGIERFDQIAEWTETDIAKIDETLNFRGRIQRERWVEQARELAKRNNG